MVKNRVAVSILVLACACVHVRGCLCSQVRHRSGFASYSHSARALVRAPIEGPDLPPTDTWDHTSL